MEVCVCVCVCVCGGGGGGGGGGGERLIENDGAYFIFPKSWPDMIIFFNTSSARKQQLKLFINKKSWSLSLNRGTVRTERVQRVHLIYSQT